MIIRLWLTTILIAVSYAVIGWVKRREPTYAEAVPA